MHEKLSLGLLLGLIGNILFIAFALICYFYYNIYEDGNIFVKIIEILAYLTEITGFAALLYSDYLINSTIRMRNLLKLGFTLYIVIEALMMIMELNSYRLEFYAPYSLALAIIHSVFSGAVCFAFLQLDPDKRCYEILITICIGVIFGGMLGNIMGIRVYFSILTNAIAYTGLFQGIRVMLRREMIEVDCHGDAARVAEYKSGSTLFDDED